MDSKAQYAEFQQLSRSLVPSFGDSAAVAVVNRERVSFDLSVAHVDRMKESSLHQAVSEFACADRDALKLRQTVVVRDGKTAPRSLRRFLKTVSARSAAILPINGSGFVATLSSRVSAFPDDEMAKLCSVARTIELLVHSMNEIASASQNASDIRHDVFQPLMGARLSLQSARGEASAIGSLSLRRCIDTAMLGIEEVTKLLNDARTLVSEGAARPSKIIVDAVDILTPLAREHGVEFVLNLAESRATAIDRIALMRAVTNLAANAIRHSRRGGRIFITSGGSPKNVIIRVQDSGEGIAKADLRHIFDPEWLATSSIRRGSGRGLAIAKQLVEAHGGSLAVHSKRGTGTTFTMMVPVAARRTPPLRAEFL